MPVFEEDLMIVKTEIDGIPYEGVLQGEFELTGTIAQFEIIVHDPDKLGGRRVAYLCPKDRIPVSHVVLGTLAIK